MRLLVIGGGGREHALVWALRRSSAVTALTCAPGNPGIAEDAVCRPVDAANPTALAALARELRADLTVVGPELPLARGVVDAFQAEHLAIVGPTERAARLESSKAFAKTFMARHGIPTARFRIASSPAEVHAVLDRGELGLPLVVKADGLAAGKGVMVAANAEEARLAVDHMMVRRAFGAAGDRMVLEECLAGEELSFFALADGRRAVPLLTAQDHKRLLDGDRGPNTGGMGAFAPAHSHRAHNARELEATILRDIVEPTIEGMVADGTPYHGVLYVGLMLTCDGPKVLEYNVRFGDPEAQVLLPLLADDLAEVLRATADSRLPGRFRWRNEFAAAVVVASRGYPDAPETGAPIAGVDEARQTGSLVFHAGTRRDGERLVTAGGRVLNVVGVAPTLSGAVGAAYQGVAQIRIDGMQYRTDIARKALAAERT